MDNYEKHKSGRERLCSILGEWLPTVSDLYSGDDDDYIIITDDGDEVLLCGDDTDLYGEEKFIIHLFTLDSSKLTRYKKKIRRLLRAAGFSIYETTLDYDARSHYYRIVVKCSVEAFYGDDYEI